MENIKILGFNPEYDLYFIYLNEYDHGYTDLDWDSWLQNWYDDDELKSFDYDMDVFDEDQEEEEK